MKKTVFTAAMMAAFSTVIFAQSGTNSPYSQYGLGLLSEQTSGFNRGMNGLGLGFHEHNQINYLNPASYSSLDSLTFIFDVGASGQLTNFKEGAHKVNAHNADLEYVVAGFRAFRHVGVSFGLVPFTNIGYNYAVSEKIGSSTTTYNTTYSGNGGLHQVYLGAGWKPMDGLSLGANISYLWGTYSRSVNNSYSDTYVNTLSRAYSADVHSYKLDLGVQYTHHLMKADWLTVGVTFSPGHKIGGQPQVIVKTTNSQTKVSVADTLPNGRKGQQSLQLSIPTMLGAGVMWNHNNKWKVGLDYSLQKWGNLDVPEYSVINGVASYSMKKGQYMDRHQVTLGGEYVPDNAGRVFYKRIHYRLGASYATPYYKVNGTNGPKELSVSAGFGLPIINGYNNRSILNISGQWVRRAATGLIKENTFRINIGLTFNERWFMKWKVD